MYQPYNPNPVGKYVGDCAVRAIAKATGQDWESVYSDLALQGFVMGDMPSSNAVWGAYLRGKGFVRDVIENTCPDCYTVAEFAQDHQSGTFILATGNHVVTVVDGAFFDTWDSGNEVPVYYWTKEGSR